MRDTRKALYVDQAIAPAQDDSLAESLRRITGGLTILIWSEHKTAAENIDEALTEVLKAYGYNPSEPESRTVFQGSFFIRYKFKRKSSDLEEDLQMEFSDEPFRRKPMPAKKRSLLSRLKATLEKSEGILVLAGVLFANVGALHEAVKQFHDLFEVPPPPTVVVHQVTQSVPLVPQPQRADEPQVITIPVPAALALIMDCAEKHPKEFELLLKFVAADHHQERHIFRHTHRRKRPKSPPPPAPPSPPGNRGTL